MKLSEAILLGSVGTGQAFGKFVDEDGNTCAQGAALAAIGRLVQLKDNTWSVDGYRNDNHARMAESWPWTHVAHEEIKCPLCDETRNYYYGLIGHVNNSHKLSRPKIAAWVATIEPQDSPVAEPITETIAQHG